MSLKITLHPLVIMNISDHWTRVKAQNDGVEQRVYGALLGTQEGNLVEVHNSFELVYNDKKPTGLEHDYLNTRLESYKKIFKNLDFVGWYSTSKSGELSDREKSVHQQLEGLNESPLYLVLKTDVDHGVAGQKKKELPITIYESVSQFTSGKQAFEFRQIGYNIDTLEAERIGVDHIAKEVSSIQKGSWYSTSLTSSLNAMRMLKGRIRTMIEMVKASDKVKSNHTFMRKLKSITNRLPITTSEDFNEEMIGEYSNVVLVNQLTSITKTFGVLNEYLNSYASMSHYADI